MGKPTGAKTRVGAHTSVCVCVCVCVYERESEWVCEQQGGKKGEHERVYVFVCVLKLSLCV